MGRRERAMATEAVAELLPRIAHAKRLPSKRCPDGWHADAQCVRGHHDDAGTELALGSAAAHRDIQL